MRQYRKLLVSLLLIVMILSACQFPSKAITKVESPKIAVVVTEEAEPLPVEAATEEPTQDVTAEPTLEPTVKQTEQTTLDVQPTPVVTEELAVQPSEAASTAYGPYNFPAGVNPLTGQLAVDPSFLRYPPALISVSNFPASARPQAGLSFSPLVFEMAIGEGMTRFLAVFYGSFPSAVSGQTEGDVAGAGSSSGSSATASSGMIGPIRSGRLPYETMRAQMNGFLVMASADAGVAATLNGTTSIFGSDSDDINSALIGVDQLERIANAQYERTGKEPYLEGIYFDQAIPAGGKTADQAWVYYSSLNQIQWDYDVDLGAFVRSDISTDGKSTFTVSTDRLNGEPIAKENVIMLFANHNYIARTKIDIDLNNVVKGKAILFRDGQAFEIFWTSKYGDYEKETGLLRPIRFMDADGNPFPLKPGETWVEIVSLASRAWETDSGRFPFNTPFNQPDSGVWAVRYYGKY